MTQTANSSPVFYSANARPLELSPRTAAKNKPSSPGSTQLLCQPHPSLQEQFKVSIKFLTADQLELSTLKNLPAKAEPSTVTPKQVIEKLETQQNIITSDAIQEALFRKFRSQTDRDLGLKVLTQMTQFANMKSLNGLQSKLVQYHNKTSQPLYYQGEPTLGSTLSYLSLKHKSTNAMTSSFTTSVMTEVDDLKSVKSGTILLDQPTKARLKSDPALCDHIRQQGIKLLYPQGWDEGVTPFNQPPLDTIMDKLVQVMNTVKQQRQADSGLSEVKVIQQALSEPTRALLKSLNLGDSLNILEPSAGYIPPHLRQNGPPTVAKVAEQLAPNQLELEQLEEALAQFPGRMEPEQTQLVLKILNEQAEVYSPFRLTKLIEEQHRDISAQAKRLGIQPENIFYYIDEKKKSYGLINYQYVQVNPVNPKQFIQRLDSLPNSADKKLLVILDDVASSGDSLVEVYNKIRERLGPKAHLHFAPLVSTNKANKVFQEIQNSDPNCTYSPSQIVTLFKDQPIYQQASLALKAKLERAVIHLGHRENGLSLAFPYMAPDNNNGFFAQYIAPLLTLNRAGCKNIEPQLPAPKTTQIAPKATSSPVVPRLDLARLQSALQALRVAGT